MDGRLQILLIDDDQDDYVLLKELVSRPAKGRILYKYDLEWVSNYEEAVGAFSDCQYDLYLVDYQLGSHTGLDLLREPAARECSVPVIMLTGQGSYTVDLSAMQLGVSDYIEKSQLTLPLLERSIRYAIERKQAEKQLQKQAQELAALQKATSSLLNTLDLSRLMGQILDAAQEAVPSAEGAWLHLVEHLNGRGKNLTEISLQDPRIHRIRLPEDLHGPLKTISECRSLMITDAQTEPALLSFLENEQERQAVRSGIVAPLVLDDEDVLGTLSLSASRSSIFSKRDLQLLTSFAATAAAALYNAILFFETQRLSTIDPLTGELNRRALFEMGQREIDRFRRFGRPLSWIMFDIDRFKQINDKYGHAAGDQVLIAIVERCCRIIRHVDILGRYGGDEFVILLTETDHQMAKEIADRIRVAVGESPVETDAGLISVSISMGVTETTPATADLRLLLNRADKALYKSKSAGGNTVTVLV